MIFAIDPGEKRSGWLVYDRQRPARPVAAAGIDINEHILRLIQGPWWPKSGHPKPWSLIAIEGMESHGRPWGTPAIDACWWGGRFEQQAIVLFLPVRKIKNVVIRRHLCGRGNVGGPAVHQALYKRFGGERWIAVGRKNNPGPLYLLPDQRGDHKWSALALAITAAETKAKGNDV